MADWSRRQVLRALGVGVATPALGPLLGACGPRARGNTGPAQRARGPEEIRAQLRDVVLELGRDYRSPSAFATLRHRGGASVDGSARGADRFPETALVLRVDTADGRHEQATSDLSVDGIARAVAWLRSRAPRDSGARAIELPAAQDFVMPLLRDPIGLGPKVWLDQVARLYERGRRVGGSRIVYRGAYLTVDDCRTLYVGEHADRSQRIVRSRAGLLLVAWTGAAPTADEAGRAGTLGFEVMDLDDDLLEAAADRALSQLTARDVPAGVTDVILDPTVVGLIASHAVAPALSAPSWIARQSRAATERLIGASGVSVLDDPTLAGGYGSYYFDDEGQLAAPRTLIDAGSVVAPITNLASAKALGVASSGHGRRPHDTAPVGVHPSNIGFARGTASAADLLASLDAGLRVEGGLSVRVDLRSWRLVVRASRAHGVQGGKASGARYGALELHATLPQLLGSVRAVGDQVEWSPRLIDRLATSAGGPAIATRAEVRRG